MPLTPLVDREHAERDSKRVAARLKAAALRHDARIEDADLRAPRGLDRALFQRLAAGEWIGRREGVLITGPTGVGKSWLACALGHKACRDGRRVLYQRVPRLFEALALSRGDGRHVRLLKTLARVELLILDDWGLSGLTQAEREDLLEILEDRHGRGSTIVTSQVPVEQWHEVIGSPTLADAILDRLVHSRRMVPAPAPGLPPSGSRPSSAGTGRPRASASAPWSRRRRSRHRSASAGAWASRRLRRPLTATRRIVLPEWLSYRWRCDREGVRDGQRERNRAGPTGWPRGGAGRPPCPPTVRPAGRRGGTRFPAARTGVRDRKRVPRAR